MKPTPRQTQITRRIVVYYLLFCLFAVVWLIGGIVFVTQSTLKSRTVNSCLADVGRAASSLSLQYLRQGTTDFEGSLQQLKRQNSLVYSAVVAPGGEVIAHTDRSLTGQQFILPEGEELQWGSVQGVRYWNDRNQPVREYRTDLISGQEKIGTLHMAVREPRWMGTVRTIGQYASIILIPLLGIAFGAWMIWRSLRSTSDLENQLGRFLATDSPAQTKLQPVYARNVAAAGWNRLVEYVSRQTIESSLEERLRDVLSRTQEDNVHAILDSLGEGIAATDDGGRVTMINPACVGLLGIAGAAEQLHGKKITKLLGWDDSSQHALLEESKLTRPVVGEVIRGHGSDQRSLRVARYPLQNDQGSARGHVWTIRDVSQQKLADAMKDQFLDSATHELRTPLANIKAYAETLTACEGLDFERQKEFCNTINTEATRLSRFIDDLLNVSSMAAGGLSIDRKKCEFERLIDQVTENARPVMQKKNIEFEIQKPAKLPELRIDKDKISAALVNLLGNASKYTPENGRVALKIRALEEVIEIEVEDTGVGIALDEVPRVFDKFFRSDDPRVRSQNGTGLGLALAQEVVRLHGGNITVRSELNVGSSFTMILPLE